MLQELPYALQAVTVTLVVTWMKWSTAFCIQSDRNKLDPSKRSCCATNSTGALSGLISLWGEGLLLWLNLDPLLKVRAVSATSIYQCIAEKKAKWIQGVAISLTPAIMLMHHVTCLTPLMSMMHCHALSTKMMSPVWGADRAKLPRVSQGYLETQCL